MGWWNVDNNGSVIGDDPLEAFEDAVENVLAAYDSAFERRPSPDEWTALLSRVFYAYASQTVTEAGWISDVTLITDKSPVPDVEPPGLPPDDARD